MSVSHEKIMLLTEDATVLAEISKWFDWMKRRMLRGKLPQLSDETTVLFAAKAVQYANELEPRYYGRGLPAQVRDRLISTRIVDECCESFWL
jgi:hypothetical protein